MVHKSKNVIPPCGYILYLSEAESYANPILSFRFWSGRKKQISFVQIERGFLCEDGAARVICLLSCYSAVRFFWTTEIQANVDCCYVWRRAECISLGPGLKGSSLRWLTLVSPRKDVPRRFTWYFFQPSIRAHATQPKVFFGLQYSSQ